MRSVTFDRNVRVLRVLVTLGISVMLAASAAGAAPRLPGTCSVTPNPAQRAGGAATVTISGQVPTDINPLLLIEVQDPAPGNDNFWSLYRDDTGAFSLTMTSHYVGTSTVTVWSRDDRTLHAKKKQAVCTFEVSP